MDWIPAISTTLLLAMVLWLCRKLIATRLTNAVKHEYDKKLENLRTILRQNEEAFKAELQAKASQIEALRNGALSGIVNRQAVLYERRLKAVEQLWGVVVSLAPAKAISNLMAVMKFDAVATEAANNPQLREFFKVMGSSFDVKSFDNRGASKARPFVTQLAWAYFSAYQTILMHAVIKSEALQRGIEKDYSDTEAIKKVVKVALPQQEAYIEKHGPSAFHYLIEELESKLLIEISNILRGEESDKESIEKAVLIQREVDRLMESNVASRHSIPLNK